MKSRLCLLSILPALLLSAVPFPEPPDTAAGSVPRLEQDSYDWYARHRRIVTEAKALDPQIVLLGDSITHFWGGETDGARGRGMKSWASLFEGRRVLNAGFGWDRTQNLRWRIEHGELDGLSPELIILHIGTNNSSTTANAPQNTPEQTANAIHAIACDLTHRFPKARLLVFDIFPREAPTSPRRQWINAVNTALANKSWPPQIHRLSAAQALTLPDGNLLPGAFIDGCHPSEKGYAALAELIRPFLPDKPAPTPAPVNPSR